MQTCSHVHMKMLTYMDMFTHAKRHRSAHMDTFTQTCSHVDELTFVDTSHMDMLTQICSHTNNTCTHE